MITLIGNDKDSSEWLYQFKNPGNAIVTNVWIINNKSNAMMSKWKVELSMKYDKYADTRFFGYGKTRHEAFVNLRKRLNNLKSLNLHS